MSKRKITMKKLPKYNTIWHPESTLVFKSIKEQVVIGRLVNDELVSLDEETLELCNQYKFKPDESLIQQESEEVEETEEVEEVEEAEEVEEVEEVEESEEVEEKTTTDEFIDFISDTKKFNITLINLFNKYKNVKEELEKSKEKIVQLESEIKSNNEKLSTIKNMFKL